MLALRNLENSGILDRTSGEDEWNLQRKDSLRRWNVPTEKRIVKPPKERLVSKTHVDGVKTKICSFEEEVVLERSRINWAVVDPKEKCLTKPAEKNFSNTRRRRLPDRGSLSQEQRALLNKEAYDNWLIEKNNVREDKKKYDLKKSKIDMEKKLRESKFQEEINRVAVKNWFEQKRKRDEDNQKALNERVYLENWIKKEKHKLRDGFIKLWKKKYSNGIYDFLPGRPTRAYSMGKKRTQDRSRILNIFHYYS